MAADSKTGYLSTLLRRGASPFHSARQSLSAPHAYVATHTPDAPPDHNPDAEHIRATFAATFEISLEETAAELRHESEPNRDAAPQSRHIGRFAPDNKRTEPQRDAPHPSNNRVEPDRAPEHIAHQSKEAQLPAAGRFATQPPIETATRFAPTSQLSSPQEKALEEISLAGVRTERLAESSFERVERFEQRVKSIDSARQSNSSDGKEARRSSIEGEPKGTSQPAERTPKVERGESAITNLNAERTKAHQATPQMNFTAQANAAFISERERGTDLRRTESLAAPGKSGTLTIKRLEVQIINQTPVPPPEPQANAQTRVPRTSRTNPLHRHHLGRFSFGQ